MDEGTQRPGNLLPTTASKPLPASPSKTRMWLIVGGTGLVLVAGLGLMQLFSARPGQAAGEPAGSAKLGAAPKRQMEVLARVGKEAVSYDMVAQEAVARYGKEILDDIINRMMIQQACEEAGVMVTEEEVTAEVSRIAKRFNLDPADWYKMLQAERNIQPMQYRQSVIWPMLALKKLAGERVEITEEEMQKAFVRNYGPRVKARLILIENRAAAEKIWQEAKSNPENFEKLAQEKSADPSSRPLGGTIPPIPRFSGNETIENAAFKLREGEISGLIEIQTGRYAILKCEGRTEQVVTDIEAVKDTLYEELFEMKTQQSVAKVFDDIKKKAAVDNFLTQTSTGSNRPFTQPQGGVEPAGGARPQGPTGVRPASATAPGSATLRR